MAFWMRVCGRRGEEDEEFGGEDELSGDITVAGAELNRTAGSRAPSSNSLSEGHFRGR